MKNMTAVSVKMNKSAGRTNYGNIYKNMIGSDESINPDKVFFAKRDLANGKQKSIALAQMNF